MRPLLDDARRAASFARRQDDVRVAAVRYPQRLAALHAHTRTKRPDLLGLLRTLATRQVSLDLVEEAEQTDLPFVFAFTPEGTVREERSGRIFATAQAATDAVLAETKARFRVYETDSRTVAGELVVRNYADGAVAVLNLSATDRALIADVDGARVPFVLPGRGVLTLAPGERPQSSTVENHVPLDVDSFTLALDAANTWRVNFDTNKVGTITVAAPLRNVRLALRTCVLSYAVTGSGRPVDSFESAPPGEKIFRHDAEPYTFEMDGRPLTAPRPCTALGVDFNPLYCETEPFELAPGVHTFRIVTGEPDQNFFLPALFVVGDSPCSTAYSVRAQKNPVSKRWRRVDLKHTPEPSPTRPRPRCPHARERGCVWTRAVSSRVSFSRGRILVSAPGHRMSGTSHPVLPGSLKSPCGRRAWRCAARWMRRVRHGTRASGRNPARRVRRGFCLPVGYIRKP